MSISRLSIILDNQTGALARVAMLFRRRSVNILALSVGETENPALSRITIVSDAPPQLVEHVKKQLEKQEYVHVAEIVPDEICVERELILAKLKKVKINDSSYSSLISRFGTKIIIDDDDIVIIEASLPHDQVEEFIAAIEPLGLLELARTGCVALQMGSEILLKKTEL